MRRRPGIPAIATAAAALALASGSASAATPTITEFDHGMGGQGTMYGITPASDGRIWFTSYAAGFDRFGSINPLNTGAGPQVLNSSTFGPWWITPGREGNMYWTTSQANSVGAVTTAGSSTHTFFGGGNPAKPFAAVTGPDGNIWMTEPRDGTALGLGTSDGVSHAVPGSPPTIDNSFRLTGNADPFGIAAGSGGAAAGPSLWATEWTGNRIARLIPVCAGPACGAVVREYAPRPAGSKPYAITLGPDGNMWFTNEGSGTIGRFPPPAGTSTDEIVVTEFPLPADAISPQAIAAGPDGNMWIGAAGGSNPSIVRMNMAGAVTGQYPVPIGRPNNIVPGSDGNLWFSGFEGNRVGRITTALDPPEFQNTGQISIPDSSAGGPDLSSTVNVAGVPGIITDVNVRVTGLSHPFPDDLEIILEPPNGQAIKLASDVGSALSSRVSPSSGKWSYPANGITLNFDDSAPFSLSDTNPLVSGFFKPTNITDPLEAAISSAEGAAPAPTPPYGATLNTQQGFGANGAWKLWVYDDSNTNNDAGSVDGKVFGGWGLDITSEVELAVTRGGTGSGTVTSAPAGIDCAGAGSICTALFPADSSVVLTASPAAGSTFASWTGCTSTNGNQCTVAMDSDKAVTANFAATPAATKPTTPAAPAPKCSKKKRKKGKCKKKKKKRR